MTEPVRLQLSRRKGFNLQALSIETNMLPAISVARPSIFGNPFTIATAISSQMAHNNAQAQKFCVECFDDWLHGGESWWSGPESFRRWAEVNDNIETLRGKNLACWCKPGTPCHADVLLKRANRVLK